MKKLFTALAVLALTAGLAGCGPTVEQAMRNCFELARLAYPHTDAQELLGSCLIARELYGDARFIEVFG